MKKFLLGGLSLIAMASTAHAQLDRGSLGPIRTHEIPWGNATFAGIDWCRAGKPAVPQWDGPVKKLCTYQFAMGASIACRDADESNAAAAARYYCKDERGANFVDDGAAEVEDTTGIDLESDDVKAFFGPWDPSRWGRDIGKAIGTAGRDISREGNAAANIFGDAWNRAISPTDIRVCGMTLSVSGLTYWACKASLASIPESCTAGAATTAGASCLAAISAASGFCGVSVATLTQAVDTCFAEVRDRMTGGSGSR